MKLQIYAIFLFQKITCMNLNINGWWIDAGTPERIIELEEKLS